MKGEIKGEEEKKIERNRERMVERNGERDGEGNIHMSPSIKKMRKKFMDLCLKFFKNL